LGNQYQIGGLRLNETNRRIVIVGAGMAGLTAAAYLSRAGYDVLLIEKNEECGGLLYSFQRQDFVFDAGARALVNSGIIQPMLHDLGITLEFLNNPVSIGVEDEIINIDTIDSLADYKEILEKLYPDSVKDIDKIISLIKKVSKDMAVLYGIDNPNFRDLKNDRTYIFKELLPWLGKFFLALYRINRMNDPIEPLLKKILSNQSLIDIIAQHFFKNTPTFFALGYFYVYLDYIYPKGGTGQIPDAIRQKVVEWGGKIQTATEITEVIPYESKIKDVNGTTYTYDQLIWCADLKTLYKIVKTDDLEEKTSRTIVNQGELYLSRRGGDSIFSLFIGVDMPPEKFGSISNAHFFYTPSKKGLGEIHWSTLKSILANFENTPKEQILRWLDEFCRLNTYEISIPALRDLSSAPEGKTGLIISLLFEYELIKKVQEAGWYEEFKTEVESRMLETLTNSIYPEIRDKVLCRFSSTPISISNKAGTSEGAITGWSYEMPVPVVNNLKSIPDSVKTPIPKVLQAGQWAYSPAGIPTAILTGWYAAQHIMKNKK
jgi:all-trans-retinol 13,14-reductase